MNAWLRESHEFDGLVDLDRILRDPARPSRLLPAYDSGDHLHPSDAGYAASADAVDLSLLEGVTQVRRISETPYGNAYRFGGPTYGDPLPALRRMTPWIRHVIASRKPH